ncbi:PucR family transcriptional regulator [Companilactobacillus sp. HBUAS59544]|uniref:PucR family transcriptional regulator n=1 Tax=Companilactobacillus sp. HBUAS59544 TaxID=3109363 RepID=UPI002FEEBFD0
MELNQIFKEFIHVVQENPDYIIGLLDINKRIVSCSDVKRVGEYISSDGNNKIYRIIVNGQILGYLWINGPQDAVSVVGNILFDSLKTRIQYELNQEMALKSLTVDDQIIEELLKKDGFNYNYISDLMKKINFNKNVSRVSIYVVNEDGFDKREIASLKYKINEHDTIYSLLDDKRLIIFKVIPEKIDEKSYKNYILTFVSGLIDWGMENNYFAIGTIQRNIELYRFSYDNCIWIRENIRMKPGEPVYFNDNLILYIMSQSKKAELDDLLNFYKNKAGSIDINEFIKIINGLYSNDFNIKKTAEKIFVHKNTLMYRIKKYEEIFKMDIRGSFQDKILVCLLANYFDCEKAENRRV